MDIHKMNYEAEIYLYQCKLRATPENMKMTRRLYVNHIDRLMREKDKVEPRQDGVRHRCFLEYIFRKPEFKARPKKDICYNLHSGGVECKEKPKFIDDWQGFEGE